MAKGIDLGKQVGPLPLGAWFAVVGTGLGIALYTRQQNAGGNSAPEVVEDTGSPDGVGEGPGWIAVPPPTTAPNTTVAITNNEEWSREAINRLIAQGYDPAVVYSGITKALSGGTGENKMSIQEYALWRMALVSLGAPPVPINVPPPTSIPIVKPPVITKPPVVTKPPQVKPKVKYATVAPWPARNSTLSGLALTYYRNANRWHDIYNANRKGVRRADGTVGMISNPNKLQPGWKLVIP